MGGHASTGLRSSFFCHESIVWACTGLDQSEAELTTSILSPSQLLPSSSLRASGC